MQPSEVFNRYIFLPELTDLQDDRAVAARIMRMLRFWANALPDAEGVRLVSQASFPELLTIWMDQLAHSRRAEKTVELLAPRSTIPDGRLFRQYHQLLCTEAGLMAKLANITCRFDTNAKILLVGDDDQLSLQLVEAGFTGVSAIDIDSTLVEHLQHRVAGRARIMVHDLTKPAPERLRDNYDLIVLDPAYSPDAIQMFVDGALGFSRGTRRPALQLYCATACLTKAGVDIVQQRFRDCGYQLTSFQPGVCKYPYPWLTRTLWTVAFQVTALVSGAWRHGVGTDLLPRHVTSDLWTFEPS